MFQFTFDVNRFIVNTGRLTHQNDIQHWRFIPVYFNGASEILAWGPLSYIAASLKQYNKERNAGIVNQRRKIPLVLKEFLQHGRDNSKHGRSIFRSFISDYGFPEYVPSLSRFVRMYLKFISPLGLHFESGSWKFKQIVPININGLPKAKFPHTGLNINFDMNI